VTVGLSEPEMMRAFLDADAGYDESFWTAVRTTGVFCRPSCRARKPRPENVEFFGSVREAMFAGYRPCKRCRPLSAPSQRPAWMDRLLAEVERDPGRRIAAEDLRAKGLNPATVRRAFVGRYGMTFAAYCRARRLHGAFHALREGRPLDDVVWESGYSHSAFREAFGRALGEPPIRSRTRDCIAMSWIESPLGPLIAGATEEGIVLLEFTDRRMLERQLRILQRRLRRPLVHGHHGHLAALADELSAYFGGSRTTFEVPVATTGTSFQETVWDVVRGIPCGQTRTYGEVARELGGPATTRAVGTANGMNRIAILVPCHRVLRADGSLGGYGGGLWRKRRLLDVERGPGAHGSSPAASGDLQTVS
jgi:AraC family transcriptional regulator of adaptative response/methylated-DNA-[protein]-cysteine methyltransferase